MSEKTSRALKTLAENLERLMESHAVLTSQAAIGRKALIDQKTVGRVLHKSHEPQLDVVSKLAKAFEMEPWQLLTPNLDPKRPPAPWPFSKLTPEQFAAASDEMKEEAEGMLRRSAEKRSGGESQEPDRRKTG